MDEESFDVGRIFEMLGERTVEFDNEALTLGGSAGSTMSIRPERIGEVLERDALRKMDELELGETMAEGGMGLVRRAVQTALGREVAVKQLHAERLTPERERELVDEARVTGKLEHPNIIPVHGLGVDDANAPLFVMRKVDGIAWVDALADSGELPTSYQDMERLEAHLEIFEHVCRAVHFAHAMGIVHRDLKPDNIMLGEHGEVYVADWGIAVSVRREDVGSGLPHVTEITGTAGTPAYMAPEMVGSDGSNIDARTDVYLLGATLHTALTGLFRHEGGSLLAVLVEAQKSRPFDYDGMIPDGLAEICNRATRLDPAERFEDVESMRRAVAAWRRRRHAIKLSERAGEELARLEATIVGGGDEVEAYRLYGSSRFGFEQALEIWPEYDEAKLGRERTHRAMFDVALGKGDLGFAESLLGDLSEDDTGRAAKLERAKAAARKERERLEELERLSKELDPREGLRAQARALGVVCVGLVMANVINAWTTSTGLVTAPFWGPMGFKLVDTILLQGFLSWMLMSPNTNTINRKALTIWMVSVWSVVVMRARGLSMDVGVAELSVMESLVYAMAYAGATLLLDPKLAGVWFVIVAGVAASTWVGEAGSMVRAAINVAMVIVVVVAWSRSSLEQEQDAADT